MYDEPLFINDQSLIDADFYTYYADGLVTVSVSCTSGTVSLAPGTFNSLVFTAGMRVLDPCCGGRGWHVWRGVKHTHTLGVVDLVIRLHFKTREFCRA